MCYFSKVQLSVLRQKTFLSLLSFLFLFVLSALPVVAQGQPDEVPVIIILGQSNADGSAGIGSSTESGNLTNLDNSLGVLPWIEANSNHNMKIWHRNVRCNPQGWTFPIALDATTLGTPGWLKLNYKNDLSNGKSAMSIGSDNNVGSANNLVQRGIEGGLLKKWGTLNAGNDTLYVLKMGIQGSQIKEWVKSGTETNWKYFRDNIAKPALTDLIAQGKKPKLAGVWWMQGEGDAEGTPYSTTSAYQEALGEIIQKCNTELGFDNPPFYIGQITRGTSKYSDSIRQAQQNLVTDSPNQVFFSFTDGLLMGDTANVHFNYASYTKIGENLVDSVVKNGSRWGGFSPKVKDWSNTTQSVEHIRDVALDFWNLSPKSCTYEYKSATAKGRSDVWGDISTVSREGTYDVRANVILPDNSAITITGASLTVSVGKIYYVASGGSGDGSSWGTPMDSISSAIAAAADGDQIWVKAGDYTVPGVGSDNDVPAISVNKSLSIYGSFAGNESSVEERAKVVDGAPWEFVNTTYTIGQKIHFELAANNIVLDGIYCVVNKNTIPDGNDANRGALIVNNKDNVTINRCVFRGFNAWLGVGVTSGLYIEGGSVSLKNSKISDNVVAYANMASALFINGGTHLVENCLITNCKGLGSGTGEAVRINAGTVTMRGCKVEKNNSGNVNGAGISILGGTNHLITGCTISENVTTEFGGGLYLKVGGVTIENCKIVANKAKQGGAFSTLMSGGWTDVSTLRNCLIANNESTANVAGVLCWNNKFDVINCTFASNKPGNANPAGVALWTLEGKGRIINSIFWNNPAVGGSVVNTGTALTLVTHNAINGALGSNKVTIDAGSANALVKFLNPSATPGQAGYSASFNWSLVAGSACLGAGTSTDAPLTDLEGATRPNPLSIGAYEGAPVLVPTANKLYVTIRGKGTKDGSSWGNAAAGVGQLQVALATDGIKEVHVGAGTYAAITATPIGGAPTCFILPSDFKMIGGYPADGGEICDPAKNKTILTRDPVLPEARVVYMKSCPAINWVLVTELNGFTVTGGLLSSTETAKNGAGICADDPMHTPRKIINCIIANNLNKHTGTGQGGKGGGLYLSKDGIEVDSCLISDNHVLLENGGWGNQSVYGGGIYAVTNFNMKNSVVSKNSVINKSGAVGSGTEIKGAFGGGIYFENAFYSQILNTVITENFCQVLSTTGNTLYYPQGGGVYLASTDVEPNGRQCTFNRCSITKNYTTGAGSTTTVADGIAPKGAGVGIKKGSKANFFSCVIANNGKIQENNMVWGAGVCNGVDADPSDAENANVVLTNCTIVRNCSGDQDARSGVQYVTLKNCILAGNGKSDNTTLAQGYKFNNVENSSFVGGGDIDLPNYFVAPSTTLGKDDLTINVNWSLKLGVAAIDAGKQTLWTLPGGAIGVGVITSELDIAGNPRLSFTNVDQGAYELLPPPLAMDEVNKRIYVKTGGTGEGSSWTNAASSDRLQNAIDFEGVKEVWVAKGTYKPTKAVKMNSAQAVTSKMFQMKEGVNVYGGFAGTETMLAQRVKGDKPWLFANATILDGDVNGNGTKDVADAQHVVYFPVANLVNDDNANFNYTKETIVNGFTIQNGFAASDATVGKGFDKSGGVQMVGKSILSECIVQNNQGKYVGGGIRMGGTDAKVESCLVKGNTCTETGGGILVMSGSATIKNSIIESNEGGKGAGVYIVNNANVNMTNCLIAHNGTESGSRWGAGVCNGAGENNSNTNVNLVNCTIVRNNSGTEWARTGVQAVVAVNCIFWGNNVEGKDVQGYNVTATNCATTGFYNGSTNTNSVPLSTDNATVQFVNPSMTRGIAGYSENLDYSLKPTSLCVNTANLATSPAFDILGVARPQWFGTDIGAYEYNGTIAPPPVAGSVVYFVKPGGGGDGSSWENAADGRDMNLFKTANRTIYMMEGTYLSGKSSGHRYDCNNTSGLTVVGGFSSGSTGTDLSKRDVWGTPTILTGKVNESLKTGIIWQPKGLFDGIHFEDGNFSEQGGGGALNINAQVNMRNCLFANNSTPGNEVDGGAVLLKGDSDNSIFYNCIFRNNSAGTGGSGGAVAVWNNADNISFTNCLIANNQTLGGALALFAPATVTNCTIVNNKGLGIFAAGLRSINASIKVKNSIIWGNTNNNGVDKSQIGNNPGNGNQISENVTYTNCAVEWADFPLTNGNIRLVADNKAITGPQFVFPSSSSGTGVANVHTAIWRIGVLSPCFGTGLPGVDVSSEDLVGVARDARIDMGAYQGGYRLKNGIVYVKETGSGNQDGSSWGNAVDGSALQSAIDDSGAKEVWVAKGTYKPIKAVKMNSAQAVTSKMFQMKEGVNVYGGFAGTETMLAQRVKGDKPWLFTNESIFDGDIDNSGTKNAGDAQHVIYFPVANLVNDDNANFNYTKETIVNGLTIQNGYSGYDPAGGGFDKGAGVQMVGKSILSECIVKNNEGKWATGGIRMGGTDAKVESCLITENRSGEHGGGIWVSSGKGWVTNSEITRNSGATTGGGIHASANMIVNNCKIKSNTANVKGGGVYASSKLVMKNTIVEHCSAGLFLEGSGHELDNILLANCGGDAAYEGGIQLNGSGAQMTLRNSTIVNMGGSATGDWAKGAAIRIDNVGKASAKSYIYNTIIWNPTDNVNAGSIMRPNGDAYEIKPYVANCRFDLSHSNGHYEDGGGNIDLDPLFVNAIMGVGYDGYAEGANWSLTVKSPCVDAGTFLSGTKTDILGVIRPQWFDVDMGAYEYDGLETPQPPLGSAVYFVSPTGTGDGSSWENAANGNNGHKTGSDADTELVFNTPGRIVYMMEGGYTGELGVNGKDHLYECGEGNGIKVYGGFSKHSKGTDISMRDVFGTPSIIDGKSAKGILWGPEGLFDGIQFINGSCPNGGAVVAITSEYNKAGPSVFKNCLFKNNQATTDGWGGAVSTNVAMTFENCKFINNSSMAEGGAVSVFDAKTSFMNCTFTGNECKKPLDPNDVSFGGAIFAKGNLGSLDITNCKFFGNKATVGGRGGAIHVGGPSTGNVNILNSEFRNNSALNNGGALRFSGSNPVSITNSLFANNHIPSAWEGGAIDYAAGTSLTVINSTFANNRAGDTKGDAICIRANTGATNFKNTLFWEQQEPVLGSATYINCATTAGTLPGGVGNITLSKTNTDPTGPQFIAPSSGKGQVADWATATWRIGLSSPCVDAGTMTDAPSTDMTGAHRTNQFDIGAYEAKNLMPNNGDVYVSLQGAGIQDGSSWANATTSDRLIESIVSAPRTHVASGTYTFDAPLVIPADKSLIGGYRLTGSSATRKLKTTSIYPWDFELKTQFTNGGAVAPVISVQGGVLDGVSAFGSTGGGVELITNNSKIYNSIVRNNSRIVDNDEKDAMGYGAGISCVHPSTDLVIKGCWVHENNLYGSKSLTGAGICLSANQENASKDNRNVTILDCMVTKNAREDLTSNASGGIFIGRSNNVVIRNTLIAHNKGGHKNGGYAANTAGIGFISGGSASTNISNCTIVRNDGAGIQVNNGGYENCIIWGNKLPDANGGSSHNAVETDYLVGSNPVMLSEANPPKFVKPSTDSTVDGWDPTSDWRLDAGSPCIDKGKTVDRLYYDFAGIPRPQGTAFEIGAYEVKNKTTLPSVISKLDSVYLSGTQISVDSHPAQMAMVSYSLNGSSFDTQTMPVDQGRYKIKVEYLDNEYYTGTGPFEFDFYVTNPIAYISKNGTSVYGNQEAFTGAIPYLYLDKTLNLNGVTEVRVEQGAYQLTETLIIPANKKLVGGFSGTNDERPQVENTKPWEFINKTEFFVCPPVTWSWNGTSWTISDAISSTLTPMATINGTVNGVTFRDYYVDKIIHAKLDIVGGTLENSVVKRFNRMGNDVNEVVTGVFISGDNGGVLKNCFVGENYNQRSHSESLCGVLVTAPNTMIDGCTFAQNQTEAGGVVKIKSANCTVKNSTFVNNAVKHGSFMIGAFGNPITIDNALIAYNQRVDGGGNEGNSGSSVFKANGGTSKIVARNCSIFKNKSNNNMSAQILYSAGNTGGGEFSNCIFWDNNQTTLPMFASNGTHTITLNNCAYDTTMSSTGITTHVNSLNLDNGTANAPRFETSPTFNAGLLSEANMLTVLAGDFNLAETSLCVNRGDNTKKADLMAPLFKHIDIGAFESQHKGSMDSWKITLPLLQNNTIASSWPTLPKNLFSFSAVPASPNFDADCAAGLFNVGPVISTGSYAVAFDNWNVMANSADSQITITVKDPIIVTMINGTIDSLRADYTTEKAKIMTAYEGYNAQIVADVIRDSNFNNWSVASVGTVAGTYAPETNYTLGNANATLTANYIPETFNRYVASSAAGSGKGYDWANASADLSAMLKVEVAKSIRVKRGTYSVVVNGGMDQNDLSVSAFTLLSGKRLYGGYSDSGDATLDSSKTVLSLGLGSSNARVLKMENGENAIDSTVVETLTIMGGSLVSGSSLQSQGADKLGGGVYMNGANTYMFNCRVIDNFALSGGGGIYLNGGKVVSTWIKGNSSSDKANFSDNSQSLDAFFGGAGVHMLGGLLKNVVVDSNFVNEISGSTNFDGGGVLMRGGEIEGSIIKENSATRGAGVLVAGATPKITQSTIIANYATKVVAGETSTGGGIYIYPTITVLSSKNVIVWGNRAITDSQVYGTTDNFTHCAIEAVSTQIPGRSFGLNSFYLHADNENILGPRFKNLYTCEPNVGSVLINRASK